MQRKFFNAGVQSFQAVGSITSGLSAGAYCYFQGPEHHHAQMAAAMVAGVVLGSESFGALTQLLNPSVWGNLSCSERVLGGVAITICAVAGVGAACGFLEDQAPLSAMGALVSYGALKGAGAFFSHRQSQPGYNSISDAQQEPRLGPGV